MKRTRSWVAAALLGMGAVGASFVPYVLGQAQTIPPLPNSAPSTAIVAESPKVPVPTAVALPAVAPVLKEARPTEKVAPPTAEKLPPVPIEKPASPIPPLNLPSAVLPEPGANGTLETKRIPTPALEETKPLPRSLAAPAKDTLRTPNLSETIPATPSRDAIPTEPAPRTGLSGPTVNRQDPAVSVVFTAPRNVRSVNPIPCSILVKNNSTSAVHQVVVRQHLPQGIELRKSLPMPEQTQRELAWNLGSLEAGQTQKVEFELVSQLRGTLNCQAHVSFTLATSNTVEIRDPQLAVKMRAPETVTAGENVPLALVVSNPGDGIAEAVKVRAQIPEGFEHTKGKSLEVDVGNLGPKETRTVQIVCLAKGMGPQKCAASASADGDLSANDAITVDVLHPKLEIAMTGPKLRYQDRKASYTLKISNPGNAPANNVTVQEIVPAAFKFVSANPSGQYDEATRTVSWGVGDLPAGESKTYSLDLIPTAPGNHRLVAQVNGARNLKSGAEIRTLVEQLSAIALELADADDPVEVGADTFYEIRVANTGSKMETNVELVCSVPEQIELRAAKNNADLRFRVEGRDLIFDPIVRLAPKADVVYRLQVRGMAPGMFRLRARVRSDNIADPIVREETTRFYNDQVTTK